MTTTRSRPETAETAADAGRRTWPWPAILLAVLAAAPVLSMVVAVVSEGQGVPPAGGLEAVSRGVGSQPDLSTT